MIESKPYRWVQVITTLTEVGHIVQLIGTTNSEDKTANLDNLMLKHRVELSETGSRPIWTSICYLRSDGEMMRGDFRIHI